MRKKTKKINYVENSDLLEELKISKEKNELTKNAIFIFEKMANNISNIYYYENEEDKKDCIAYALEDVIKYWKNYDIDKSNNVFSYFSSIIINGLKKGWKKIYHKKNLTTFIEKNDLFNI